MSTPQIFSSSTIFPSPGSHHLSKCPLPSQRPHHLLSPFPATLNATPPALTWFAHCPAVPTFPLTPAPADAATGARTTCSPYLGLSEGSHSSAARQVPAPPLPPSRRRHLRARERGHCAEPARAAGGGCCGADKPPPPPPPPLSRLRGRARPPRPGRTRGAAAAARCRSPGAAAAQPPPSPAGPPGDSSGPPARSRRWHFPLAPRAPPSPLSPTPGGRQGLQAPPAGKCPTPSLWHLGSGLKGMHV